MNNLEPYRDNILGKIERNKTLEELIKWINKFVDYGDVINLNIGKFAPKYPIDRELFIRILEEIVKENNKLIDMYLKLSFKEDNKDGEQKTDFTESN